MNSKKRCPPVESTYYTISLFDIFIDYQIYVHLLQVKSIVEKATNSIPRWCDSHIDGQEMSHF
jgi:hypothetical protein